MHEELLSLLPRKNLTRRGFVATTLTAGFALAVQPISADTITTDTKGLETGEVKIPTPDGEMPAYRAMPIHGKSLPVVLVVQEIFGVHEHIKDICRRLAKLGYFAVAPELFARQADVSKMTDFREIVEKVLPKVGDAQVMADLDSSIAWAKTTGETDTSKLAITGFCWGGRIVWLYAAHNPNLKAGVAWYGRLVGKTDKLHPEYPVDIAASLKAPVLGLYGGADQGIPPKDIDQMREAYKMPKALPKLSSIPTLLTASMPIIDRAIRPKQPMMAGNACWLGSKSTAWPDKGRLARFQVLNHIT